MARNKYNFSIDILNEWNSALAWLLGWTITDGCVEKKTRYVVSWMLKDREPLEIIQQLFKTNKPIEEVYKTDKKTREKRKYYRLRLCGKQVTQKFIELGINPNKTFTTRFPPIPKELIWHFLRGVMEGDGTITIRSGGDFNKEDYIRLTVEIASSTEVFPKQILEVVGYGRYTPNYAEEGHKSHRASFDCSYAVKFLNVIYENSEGLRLTRKYEQWQAFLKTGKTYR